MAVDKPVSTTQIGEGSRTVSEKDSAVDEELVLGSGNSTNEVIGINKDVILWTARIPSIDGILNKFSNRGLEAQFISIHEVTCEASFPSLQILLPSIRHFINLTKIEAVLELPLELHLPKAGQVPVEDDRMNIDESIT